MIIKMAWKNIFRYKRRTLITASAIAFGVFFTILMDALLFGMDNESLQNLLDYETGGAKIFAKGYFEEREKYPVNYLISAEEKQQIFSELDKQKKKYTPQVFASSEIYFNEDYFPASGSISSVLIGVDIEKSKDVFLTSTKIEQGRWFTEEDKSFGGVIIGSWIAQDMNAEPGYYLTVQCKGKGGFTQTMDVPIIGIIQTPDINVNMNHVYMDIDFLDQMLEMEGDVTAISIDLGSQSTVDKNFTKLSQSLLLPENTELYSWSQIERDLISIQALYSNLTSVLMFFMFIVAAVGISNTMLMSVLERRNEIAMLKAMGYTHFYILRLFMYEGISIGIVGCILGMIIAFIANIPLSVYGLDFTNMLGEVDIGYRISGIMKSGWNLSGFISISLGSLLVCAIASYIPAVSTVKEETAEIFRKV